MKNGKYVAAFIAGALIASLVCVLALNNKDDSGPVATKALVETARWEGLEEIYYPIIEAAEDAEDTLDRTENNYSDLAYEEEQEAYGAEDAIEPVMEAWVESVEEHDDNMTHDEQKAAEEVEQDLLSSGTE